jgi:type IV pilus assembly protein PilY1
VAAFGGGFAGGASSTGTTATSAYGSYVYVLELEPDGTKSTASCGATGSSVVTSTGGHVLTAAAVASDSTSNIPNGVTADLTVITGDGTSLANYYGGLAYFTDLQGKLWKFNLSKPNLTDGNASLFTLYESFLDQATLANDRLAYNQLGSTVVAGTTAAGVAVNRLFNYFGSGDMIRLQRRVSTINNRIFGVMDSDFPATLLSKTNQTVSTFTNVNAQQCSVDNSWYADVWAKTGVSPAADFQKIVGRAAVYNKYVYFSAYQPEALSCPLYGTSRLIEVTDSCQTGSGGAIIGQGLATAPVVDSRGNIYVGMSNLAPSSSLPSGRDNLAKLNSSNLASTGKVKYKSWREKKVY